MPLKHLMAALIIAELLLTALAFGILERDALAGSGAAHLGGIRNVLLFVALAGAVLATVSTWFLWAWLLSVAMTILTAQPSAPRMWLEVATTASCLRTLSRGVAVAVILIRDRLGLPNDLAPELGLGLLISGLPDGVLGRLAAQVNPFEVAFVFLLVRGLRRQAGCHWMVATAVVVSVWAGLSLAGAGASTWIKP